MLGKDFLSTKAITDLPRPDEFLLFADDLVDCHGFYTVENDEPTGFFVFWEPEPGTTTLHIMDRATSSTYIDEVYPEANRDAPWKLANDYPYLIASIFCCLNYFIRGEAEPDFRASVFIRDLAENYFSTALLACPSESVLLFTPQVDGEAVINSIFESYDYMIDGLYVDEDTIDYAWQYSEKVRKGEI